MTLDIKVFANCHELYSESNVAQTQGKTVYLLLATDTTNYVTPRHIKYITPCQIKIISISQIPQCTCPISHFGTEIWAFCQISCIVRYGIGASYNRDIHLNLNIVQTQRYPQGAWKHTSIDVDQRMRIHVCSHYVNDWCRCQIFKISSYRTVFENNLLEIRYITEYVWFQSMMAANRPAHTDAQITAYTYDTKTLCLGESLCAQWAYESVYIFSQVLAWIYVRGEMDPFGARWTVVHLAPSWVVHLAPNINI